MRSLLLVGFGVFGLGGFGPALAGPPPVGPQDQVLGRADAPVTVIEYASLTCPHCGHWESQVFPQVKQDLIDTGKIRFVFRDYPLDGKALRAAQLAHCSGDDRFWGFLQAEFGSQTAWAFNDRDPTDALVKIGKLGGLPEAQARACMEDDTLAKSILDSREQGETAGVTGTPTFFINGRKEQVSEISYDAFVKLLHDPS
jgi:protein-disulfide isomerase